MKDCEYTLELSDGTTVTVGPAGDERRPDVKAFDLPPGTLQPFSRKNLPSARRDGARSESELSPAF
jgi:hypothetical protein